jgi:hypothetical protein
VYEEVLEYASGPRDVALVRRGWPGVTNRACRRYRRLSGASPPRNRRRSASGSPSAGPPPRTPPGPPWPRSPRGPPLSASRRTPADRRRGRRRSARRALSLRRRSPRRRARPLLPPRRTYAPHRPPPPPSLPVRHPHRRSPGRRRRGARRASWHGTCLSGRPPTIRSSRPKPPSATLAPLYPCTGKDGAPSVPRTSVTQRPSSGPGETASATAGRPISWPVPARRPAGPPAGYRA